jgi:hypothetical protein
MAPPDFGDREFRPGISAPTAQPGSPMSERSPPTTMGPAEQHPPGLAPLNPEAYSQMHKDPGYASYPAGVPDNTRPRPPHPSQVSQVPIFTGNNTANSMSAHEWLEVLDDNANLWQWSPSSRVRVALSRLQGSASVQWKRGLSPDITWDHFCADFLEGFGKSRETALTRLTTCRQRQHESVYEYAERFRRDAFLAGRVEDDALRFQFISGLRSDLQWEVRRERHNIHSMADAIRTATFWESSSRQGTYGNGPALPRGADNERRYDRRYDQPPPRNPPNPRYGDIPYYHDNYRAAPRPIYDNSRMQQYNPQPQDNRQYRGNDRSYYQPQGPDVNRQGPSRPQSPNAPQAAPRPESVNRPPPRPAAEYDNGVSDLASQFQDMRLQVADGYDQRYGIYGNFNTFDPVPNTNQAPPEAFGSPFYPSPDSPTASYGTVRGPIKMVIRAYTVEFLGPRRTLPSMVGPYVKVSKSMDVCGCVGVLHCPPNTSPLKI